MSTEAWHPYDPCPCGCGAISWKLLRPLRSTGEVHGNGCTCRGHTGVRNRRSGSRKQSAVLKDAARAEGTSMEIAPTHEEQARLLVHYESKSGTSLPRGMRGDTMRHWEDQARNFAQRQVPTRKWALVFTFPGRPRKRRIWMDYEEWLALVQELASLP